MRPLFLLAVLAAAGQAQEMTGDWQGTLHTGVNDLHLVLHIAAGPNGTLRASMDSLDQDALGIPISQIAMNDGQLTFTSEAVHGTFSGKADATSIEGTWTQGDPLPLKWTRAVKPSDIDGSWEGTLDAGEKLRLVLHVTTTRDGLAASLDSPDQGAAAIPVGKIAREGTSLTFEMPDLGARFQGTITADRSLVDGKFSQGGATFPLTLKRPNPNRGADPPRRPQTPTKPYPYPSESVTYRNPGARIELAGTLTIPRGDGPFRAVILISGSGQQDQDETIVGHKPFLVLADYFTRQGIAVLRSHDRGVAGPEGKSGGDFAASTTADFATDVESAVAYLKTRPEIDSHKIGLAGHSEGGVIAPMVAARNQDVAFIVMMAGTGLPGGEISVAQAAASLDAAGAGHEAVAQAAAKQRRVVDLFMHESGDALKQKLAAEGIPESTYLPLIRSPWFRYFLTYDPATALRKVKCPVLAINGEKDVQVPPKLNLPAIRKALQEGGNRHFEIVEFPGLNHLFQHAKTGVVSEYGLIEETFAPEALEKIATWILAQ